MSAIVSNIITMGTTTYVGQKALRCFGKKDYADVIAFVGWCFVGVEVFALVGGMLDASTEWMVNAKQLLDSAKASPLGDFLKGLLGK